MSLVCEKRPDAQPTFIPVSVKTLRPSLGLPVSLYVRESRNAPCRLYREKDVPFNQSDLDNLLERGLTTLFMEAEEHANYQRYLQDHLEAVLADESIPVTARFSSLNEVVRDVLAESFRDGNVDETIAVCHEMARYSVDLICRQDTVAGDLVGVLYHDYQTFTHSANVAYYCVMLARAMGLSDREKLHEIAVGGLLHDLGKLEIPGKILNKPGPLTREEFLIVQEHPRTGFLKLCRRNDITRGQLMMVYQHHERLNGKGYPVGLTGAEMHDWARLCAVVDVYEALTSNRPYRAGLPRAEAFAIMNRDAGTALDKDLLTCWTATINSN